MMKKMLLCVGLMGFVGNMHAMFNQMPQHARAPRGGLETIGLIGIGSAGSAGLGWLAHTIVTKYPQQSNTIKAGTVLTAAGLTLIGVESYLQYNQVASSFDTPAKIIAGLLVFVGFAAAAHNS